MAETQPDRISILGISVTIALVAAGILVLAGILRKAEHALGGDPHKPYHQARILPDAEDSTWVKAAQDRSAAGSPSFPLLQTSPAADLARFRAGEDSILMGYGWADRRAGKVRIPVERAMQLLAERGYALHIRE